MSIKPGQAQLKRRNPKSAPAEIAEAVRRDRPDLVDTPVGYRGSGEKKLFSFQSAEQHLNEEVERLAKSRGLTNDSATRAVLAREVMARDGRIGRAFYRGDDNLDFTEDDDTPRRSPIPMTEEDGDVLKRFEEAVMAELAERRLEDTYQNRAVVGSELRVKDPSLAPSRYGRRRS